MEKIKNHLKRTKKITIAETFKKVNWSKDTQLWTSSNDANIQSFATSRTLNSQALPSPRSNFTPSRPSWIGISESASTWIHKTGVCKSISHTAIGSKPNYTHSNPFSREKLILTTPVQTNTTTHQPNPNISVHKANFSGSVMRVSWTLNLVTCTNSTRREKI